MIRVNERRMGITLNVLWFLWNAFMVAFNTSTFGFVFHAMCATIHACILTYWLDRVR